MYSRITGYDGGDCCECTCVSNDEHTCGENGGFSCIDPGASCAGDGVATPFSVLEDETILEERDIPCTESYLSDGDCDPINNREECGE